ncbi:TonB-dependent receptor [uncultured Dokdonia sp.]|uniref:TonB-dependent receptor n=1 Tax=uncultured Dokdonia sp. TaxID=575653 RepID=UPI00263272DA|nr:TonB-dependent receptor [uncultured Dokdonia sp.]
MNYLFALFFFLCASTYAQTTISGTVTDPKGIPIEGANVYLDGTYDGASSTVDGTFSFTTSETGDQVLIVTFLSFETYSFFGPVSSMKELPIKLKEDINSLDTVVISAGSFEASDNSKISVLKPLDVVTTASALGDFVGALQTLPGTTTVAEDGRLFVRGGDAGETQIFIDGIRVFTPYTPTTNNIPTRGRYSPFLFDGITFSTGGYSAEYGEALSSVLLLNTVDEPDQNKTDISIMSVGGGLGMTRKWEKSSLSLSTSYINLAPYIEVFPDRNDWSKPFEALSGEAVYRYRTTDGLFKLYTAFDTSNFELTQEDINLEDGLDFKLKNSNLYVNTSYTGVLSDTWSIQTGGSYTFAKTDVGVMTNDIDNTENSAHFKLKVKKRFSSRFKLSMGAEQFITDFNEDFSGVFNTQTIGDSYGYDSAISALFTEGDVIFSKKLALKAGLRGSYTNLTDQFTISPRVSLAYKTGKKSQLSLAYGDFYQNPTNDFLKFSQELEAQKTQHYILNYQYNSNGRIFRAEAYRKSYDNLVTFDTDFAGVDSVFENGGDGYAQGLDLFWRDNTSIKNMDYWVSYSFLDSERQYLNFPEQARPSFANTHNFSGVVKYFITDWKSQVGLSYQYASGRTHTNPNVPGFLQEETKSFNSLSLNWAYLLSQQKILYVSVNNVLGFNNVNGFQYSNTPNGNGTFDRRALTPAADQFFFVGFFWTISDDNNSNQLDNL